VREYRGRGGDRRIWYEPAEIEGIAIGELTRYALLPHASNDDVTVDLEGLVETHLKCPFDQYAKLDSDVLGVTHFMPGKTPRISINADLTGSALDDEDASLSLKGRWRATVAHEVMHVLLHRLLYELDDLQRGLFSAQAANAPANLHRCLKRDVGFRSAPSDWREVQANKGMAALLMPRPVLIEVVRQERKRLNLGDRALQAGAPEQGSLVTALCRRFTVSREAASIRLDSLSLVQASAQRAF
jgi:hypothetical protein